jgi:hypothetical protein
MLPAAGILLTERLYIGIQINSINDEPHSEYADQFYGSFNIDILGGRDQGFVVICNGVKVVSTNGKGIAYTGLQGGVDSDRNTNAESFGFTYDLDIYDRATQIKNSAKVRIGYAGQANATGSWITYNGTDYTTGSFYFLNHH